MEIVRRDPEILGGTPCFAGTRVPVSILFEYLSTGSTINEFLLQYPTVRLEQVQSLLLDAERRFVDERRAAG